MSLLFVPYNNDWNKETPLWLIGFKVIHVDESDIENDIVWFEYQVKNVNASKWDNFSVSVNLKTLRLKGDGSRKFRKYILNTVLFWYLKAKNDKEFETLLNF